MVAAAALPALAQQRDVAKHMAVTDFAPGEVVIREGDIGDCLYVVACESL